MFGLVLNPITFAVNTLIPVYFAHRVLRTRSPASGGDDLVPLVQYFSCLGLAVGVEFNFYWLISWVPFWSIFRLLGYVFLLLPGPNGRSTTATWLYEQHISPFIQHHEGEIDGVLARGYEKLNQLGLAHVKDAMNWARVKLGLEPARPPPPPPPATSTYAELLVNQFARRYMGTGGVTTPAASPGAAYDAIPEVVRGFFQGGAGSTGVDAQGVQDPRQRSGQKTPSESSDEDDLAYGRPSAHSKYE